MKTLKITLLSFLFTIAVTAQNIITIDNNPESTTAQQTLQEALDIAMSGDIIYIQPSATSYGTATIDKAITIVGRSHSEATAESRAGNLTVRSSGVTIKGINFGSLTTNSAGPIPPPYIGLRVYECEIGSVTLGTSTAISVTDYLDDVEIQGCSFSSLDQRNDAQNILIGNNIIRSSFLVRSPATLIVSNNIFRSGTSNITLQNTSTTETAIFFNNMFKTNSALDRIVSLNTGDFNFSNCLTYNYGAGTLTFSAVGSATFLENNSLINTDPLFVDVDTTVTTSFAGNSATYNPAIRMDDLTLQATSPALTGGGGGSQIGLFNNGFNYNYLGNPRDIPTLDIINYDAAVPKNGTINVTIKAKAN